MVVQPGGETAEGTLENVPSKHVPASDVPPTPAGVPATHVPATGGALNHRQEQGRRPLCSWSFPYE